MLVVNHQCMIRNHLTRWLGQFPFWTKAKLSTCLLCDWWAYISVEANTFNSCTKQQTDKHDEFYRSHPVCVNTISIYIFTSYTTINTIIYAIKCYKFNSYMFRSPLRPSSGQLLQIVRLHSAYNMGSHNVHIILYICTKITVKSLHCYIITIFLLMY